MNAANEIPFIIQTLWQREIIYSERGNAHKTLMKTKRKQVNLLRKYILVMPKLYAI